MRRGRGPGGPGAGRRAAGPGRAARAAGRGPRAVRPPVATPSATWRSSAGFPLARWQPARRTWVDPDRAAGRHSRVDLGGVVGAGRVAAAAAGSTCATARPVVVAAHPDDEVLGVGGLVRLLAGSGRGCGSCGRPMARRRTRARTARSCATWPRSAGRSRRPRWRRLGAGQAPRVRLELPDRGLGRRRRRPGPAGALRRATPTTWCSPRGPATGTRTTRRSARPPARSKPAGARVPGVGLARARPGDARVPWERAVRVDLDGPDPGREGRRGRLLPQPGGAGRSARRGRPGAPARCPRALRRGTTRCLLPVTVRPDYFDRGLRGGGRPVGPRARRWYERRKRARSLAALPQERYRRGFEPGCAVGALTVGLAGRCDELLAVDRHERPWPPPPRRWPVTRTCGSAGWTCRRSGRTAGSTWWSSPRSATTSRARTWPRLAGPPRPRSRPAARCSACHWRHPAPTTPSPATRCTGCSRRSRAARPRRPPPRGGLRPRRAGPAAPSRRRPAPRDWPVTRPLRWGVVVPARDEEDLLPGCAPRAGRRPARSGRRHGVDVDVRGGRSTPAATGPPPSSPGPRGAVVQSEAGARRRTGPGRRAAAALLGGPARRGRPRSAGWRRPTPTPGCPRTGWSARCPSRTAGADVVLGTVFVDDWAALPSRRERRWQATYVARDGHGHVHGANAGLRLDTYLAVGGFADLDRDEDVALAAATRAPPGGAHRRASRSSPAPGCAAGRPRRLRRAPGPAGLTARQPPGRSVRRQPGLRVDQSGVDVELEVQVAAGRVAGRADRADDLRRCPPRRPRRCRAGSGGCRSSSAAPRRRRRARRRSANRTRCSTRRPRRRRRGRPGSGCRRTRSGRCRCAACRRR